MKRLLAAFSLTLLAGFADAQAQTYPSRQITLVVPFPPGGSTDAAARILAERMRASLGQPIIIENVGGAGGSIAVGRGAGSAMTDLVAGTVDLLVVQGAVALPQIRAGKIKAFANLSPQRSASMPDIPTADETGVPGLYMSGWFGFFAPKGTPKDVIAKLNAATVEALADPAIQKRFTELGLDVAPREQQTPEGLAAFQKYEIDKWWPIIKTAGIGAQAQ